VQGDLNFPSWKERRPKGEGVQGGERLEGKSRKTFRNNGVYDRGGFKTWNAADKKKTQNEELLMNIGRGLGGSPDRHQE